jgi:hypothetical protein
MASNLVSSLLPAIIGMGTKIGTAIPGLRKQPKQDSAKQVAKTATSMFGGAVGAAQSGHGASGGLALRAGLRSANQAVGKVAGQVGLAAQRDHAANTAQKLARADRIASFGTDLAKGLGDMAAIGIGKKGDSTMQDPDRAPVEVSGTGFGEPQQDQDAFSGDLKSLEQDMADQEQVEQQQLIDDAGAQLDDFRSRREEAGVGLDAPKEAFQMEPTERLIGEMPPQASREIEQQLADKLHMQELALAEMERQGISFETQLPRIKRRLGLMPGQNRSNPLGEDTGDLA